MDGQIDFSRMSRKELEESLRNIDRDAYPLNFARLQEALAQDPLPAASANPSLTPPIRFSVRFSVPDGPLHAVSPPRNSFGLVGAGNVEVGVTEVTLRARRVGLLPPLGFQRAISLDRNSITNVELADRVVLFHGRGAKGPLRGTPVWLKDAEDATRLANLLGTKATTAIRPQLHRLLEAEKDLLARSPRTPVTLCLILANIIAFGLSVVLQPKLHDVFSPYVSLGANFGIYTIDGEWWRLLSYQFLHLGPLHLLFNLWALAAVGPVAERLYGSLLYATFYLLTGVIAGLASMAWHPDLVSVGASGAIFGLFGAILGALLLRRNDLPAVLWRPLLRYAALFAFLSLISGMNNAMVDNAAHWGGLLAGAALSLVLNDHGTTAGPALVSRTVRIAATAIFSAAMVAVGVWIGLQRAQSMQGEAAYARTLHWMNRREAIVNDAYNRDVELAKSDRIADAEFVKDLNSVVIPFWSDSAARWSRVQLPASSAKIESLQLLRSLSANRTAAYEHLAGAIARGDTAATKAAFEELNRVEKSLKDFAKSHRSQ